jgi:hypothetical protein
MGGGFPGAIGSNTITATKPYLVVATKLASNPSVNCNMTIDDVSVMGEEPYNYADFNIDGFVNFKDYADLVANWLVAN